MDSLEPCTCADCPACHRRAALKIARYVLEKRYRQRRSYNRSDPQERDYVHRQLKLLLAMTGLMDEEKFDTQEMHRMDWGKAMRNLQ